MWWMRTCEVLRHIPTTSFCSAWLVGSATSRSALIKMWLKTPVEEAPAGGRRFTGGKDRSAPTSGVIALLANIYANRFLNTGA